MSYDNNMTGIISKNERKEKDTHPDIRGECEINGEKFWISGWVKNRKDNSGKFYSLKFELKDKAHKPSSQSKPAKQASSFDDIDEAIPF